MIRAIVIGTITWAAVVNVAMAGPCDFPAAEYTPTPLENAYAMCVRTNHHDEPSCLTITEAYKKSGIEENRKKDDSERYAKRIDCEQEYIGTVIKSLGGTPAPKRPLSAYMMGVGSMRNGHEFHIQ